MSDYISAPNFVYIVLAARFESCLSLNVYQFGVFLWLGTVNFEMPELLCVDMFIKQT